MTSSPTISSKSRVSAVRVVCSVDEVESFLAPPIIYVQEKFADDFAAIEAELPEHTVLPAEKGKSSFGVEFASIAERERAVEVMHTAGLRFRTARRSSPSVSPATSSGA